MPLAADEERAAVSEQHACSEDDPPAKAATRANGLWSRCVTRGHRSSPDATDPIKIRDASCEDVMQNIAGDVGQAEVAAGVAIGELLVIEAQQL